MKEANKYNAEYTIVLGDNEIASEKCRLKRMADSKEIEADLNRLYDDILLFEELLHKQTSTQNAD
jgi:histidyl-tRNA synthetase